MDILPQLCHGKIVRQLTVLVVLSWIYHTLNISISEKGSGHLKQTNVWLAGATTACSPN